MEIISLSYHCLHFKFNKRRYFFGLANSLADDLSALKKIKTDFIILPSFPYFIEQSIFLWHLEALPFVNCQHIIVADMTVKKRLESLMAGVAHVVVGVLKWEMMKQHELVQEQLMKVYEENCLKNRVVPLLTEPNGLGYNEGSDKLNIIVSETGRSLLLVHQSDSIIIDPPECIEEFLTFYGIPLDSLKAVILTKPNNYNILELFFKCTSISVITTESIYTQLKRLLKAYFLWDQTMIRRRMRGKILTEPQRSSNFRSLDFSFKENKLKNLEYLDIVFALKRVRIYPQQIDIYPAEILNQKDLDLLILYDIEEGIKKELETSPEVYRKKIIYNRVTRKYNNKYFYTIGSKSDYFTVKAHPYKSDQMKTALIDLSFLFKQKDANDRLSYKEIMAGERFNASERVIYVRQGYIKDDKGTIYGANSSVNQAKEIIGVKNAFIMYETLRNVYFNEGSKLVDPHNFLTSEDLLKKVKDNSFIKTLKKRKQGPENLQSEEVQLGSQWEILNSICCLKTYEAGLNLGKAQNIYLIVKGAMKFKEGEATATKGMGIGNIRRFFSHIYDDNDSIEVVKDAWAIEICLKELHCKFFALFPSRMYELFSRPLIFQ